MTCVDATSASRHFLAADQKRMQGCQEQADCVGQFFEQAPPPPIVPQEQPTEREDARYNEVKAKYIAMVPNENIGVLGTRSTSRQIETSTVKQIRFSCECYADQRRRRRRANTSARKAHGFQKIGSAKLLLAPKASFIRTTSLRRCVFSTPWKPAE